MVDDETLRAHVDQSFELENAAGAIAAFKSGKRDKIAVRVR